MVGNRADGSVAQSIPAESWALQRATFRFLPMAGSCHSSSLSFCEGHLASLLMQTFRYFFSVILQNFFFNLYPQLKVAIKRLAPLRHLQFPECRGGAAEGKAKLKTGAEAHRAQQTRGGSLHILPAGDLGESH